MKTGGTYSDELLCDDCGGQISGPAFPYVESWDLTAYYPPSFPTDVKWLCGQCLWSLLEEEK